jgi:hypothetical protein
MASSTQIRQLVQKLQIFEQNKCRFGFCHGRFARYEGMKVNLFAKLSLINRFNLVAFLSFWFVSLNSWLNKNMGRPRDVFGSFVKSTFDVDREF